MKKNIDTINENAEELEVANIGNIKTNEELLQHLIDKNVTKIEMIFVAGQMFIEYKKEMDD